LFCDVSVLHFINHKKNVFLGNFFKRLISFLPQNQDRGDGLFISFDFFFNLCGGILGTAASTGLLYQPRMIGEVDCGEIGGMNLLSTLVVGTGY
jgi:hypothetical protein